MSLIIKNIVDAPITTWAGGNITQLAIYPPEQIYEDRRFLWYVSLASVELETSHFTVMPDYVRYIIMLDRSVMLHHDRSNTINICPMVPHFFDGSSNTVSMGRSRDFNLILRKGLSDGDLSSFFITSGESKEIVEDLTPPFRHFSCLIYCSRGQCRLIHQDMEEKELCAGQYSFSNHGLVVENSSLSQTELIVCRIYH